VTEKPEFKPKRVEMKVDTIPCPACGKTAAKTSWVVGRFLAWTIKCPNCKYTQDYHALLKDGEQN
jgi:phage FluMu protein Com